MDTGVRSKHSNKILVLKSQQASGVGFRLPAVQDAVVELRLDSDVQGEYAVCRMLTFSASSWKASFQILCPQVPQAVTGARAQAQSNMLGSSDYGLGLGVFEVWDFGLRVTSCGSLRTAIACLL